MFPPKIMSKIVAIMQYLRKTLDTFNLAVNLKKR
jgi:hypothetical protein